MDTQTKLATLRKVAQSFNAKDITWAVGASLLLYFKGIVENFQDIDILIAQEDVSAAKAVLDDFGTLKEKHPNAQYATQVFLEYEIDGVDFDVIAGFAIIAGGETHHFPLLKDNIRDAVLLDGVTIPLQSLDEWHTYYTLMGRTEKARMIENGPIIP